MRIIRTVAGVIFAALTLGLSAPANAASVPVEPESGTRFDTTDVADFWVEREAADRPWAIVLSPDRDTQRGRGMIFPVGRDESAEVDMGWLAAKFNQLGSFYWSVCDYDMREHMLHEDTCSKPRIFYISFRKSTLTSYQARSAAKRVFKKLAFGAPSNGVGVECRRVSRTKRSCRVGGYYGDTAIYGRVLLWNKRPKGVRTYDLTRYHARLRAYDEYCHLVNKRPRRECDRHFKTRTGLTWQV